MSDIYTVQNYNFITRIKADRFEENAPQIRFTIIQKKFLLKNLTKGILIVVSLQYHFNIIIN